LIYKLYNIIPCGRVVKLIEHMLSDRRFCVFANDKSSKFKTLNNGLPQGSVLAPLLFNVYTHDLPCTTSQKFIYADDLALTFQHKDFNVIEKYLTTDLKIISQYFKNCPNPNKTEVSCFHLNNHQANKTLSIKLDDKLLKHNFAPTYLGVTLDRTLNYNQHIEKVRQKTKTRNNIISKLAGSNWSADADTLRTAGIALVYSVAEYCCPVWMNSCHVHKVNSQLNTTMRIISGTMKSTPTSWLPVLSHITPPEIRRKHFAKMEWDKYQQNPNKFPIHKDLRQEIPNRLKSRKPFWKENYLLEPFSSSELWTLNWQNVELINKNLISDPTMKVPEFNQPRKIWSLINRLRTCHGRCNDMLYKWNIITSPLCDCGEKPETIQHIVEECSLTRFEDGFAAIHHLTPNALEWISNLKPL